MAVQSVSSVAATFGDATNSLTANRLYRMRASVNFVTGESRTDVSRHWPRHHGRINSDRVKEYDLKISQSATYRACSS
jgi:hypothetical protein